MASSFGVLRCGKATAFGSVLSKTGTQGRRPVAGSTRVFAAQFRCCNGSSGASPCVQEIRSSICLMLTVGKGRAMAMLLSGTQKA